MEQVDRERIVARIAHVQGAINTQRRVLSDEELTHFAQGVHEGRAISLRDEKNWLEWLLRVGQD